MSLLSSDFVRSRIELEAFEGDGALEDDRRRVPGVLEPERCILEPIGLSSESTLPVEFRRLIGRLCDFVGISSRASFDFDDLIRES